jgi:tetratricopeptide (TPR) repeat protein
MITEAIVIGAVEAAVFWEDDNLLAVRLDPAADGLIDCSRDVEWLLSIGAEKRRLLQPPRNLGELGVELRGWSQRHRALTLIISGMDTGLTGKTRTSCILGAEESLHHAPSAAFARARLFGCPLPEEADLDGALRLAVEANATRARALYGDLSEAKPYLGTTRQLLESELRYEFRDHFDPERALRALIDSGIMADAIVATARRDAAALNGLIFRHAEYPELTEVLPRAVHFLTRFVTAIKHMVGEWEGAGSTSFVAEVDDASEAEAGEDRFLQILEEWQADVASQSRQRRRQPRSPLAADEALRQVDRQKDFIVESLRKGRIGRAENAILALISRQRGDSTLTHVCKSLCDLGAAATRLRFFGLAQRLYRAAKVANEKDACPLTCYAETLRQMGRLDDALEAYDKARSAFPHDVVPLNGYAETLRQMGRLEDALEAYDKARSAFPHDAYPLNGYAETLRQMGQIELAEKEFRGILEQFPTGRVARNALACLLIDLGRISEAKALVAVEEPKTEQDWRDFHVLAMAFLKEENYEEGDKRLSYGAQVALFQAQKDVFTAALAFAKLRRRQFQEVSALIERDNVLEFRLPAVAVVNAHAKAELGERDRAEESLVDAERSRSGPVVRLSDFLRRRYALGPYSGRLPDKDEAAGLDALITEAEFDLALRIAA